VSRLRPAYEPKRIACRECGGPLLLKDERTVQRVCDHCGSLLELTETEQKVLERRSSAASGVAYEIGLQERLAIDGVTYEVIARVCLIEDGDVEDQTHQYYLYNPRHRPLWLSVYGGAWDLSWRTRVRLERDPFAEDSDYIGSYDGRWWERMEVGETEVWHIDGALPYTLRTGDRSSYSDLSLDGDLGTAFEVVRTADEIEYGEGRSVAVTDVARWLGRPIGGVGGSSSESVPVRKSPRGALFMIAASAALVCVGLVTMECKSHESGRLAARFTADPQDLQANALTPSFPVTQEEDTLRLRVVAPLDNAWMYSQLAVVEADGDTVIHVTDLELSYYHGVSGGESWSEGTNWADVFVQLEEPGEYRLLLGGTSGYGEQTSAVAQHSVTVEVYTGAEDMRAAFDGLIGAIGIAIIAALLLVVAVQMLGSRGRRVAWGIAIVASLLIVTDGAVFASRAMSGAGTPELEHPEGISIRQSSVPDRPGMPFFFVYSSPRSHLGGGVHAGK